MPCEEQRSSVSSDIGFIKLGQADEPFSTSTKCPCRTICLAFLLSLFLLLLSVAVAACALLGLVVFGKICVHHGAGGTLPTAVGPCSDALASSNNAQQRHPLYINLMMDVAGMDICEKPIRPTMPLPCKRGREFITGSRYASSKSEAKFGYPLGPLACKDDAFDTENGDRNNCAENSFRLAFNDTGVTIPESGVYRVHSTMSFIDQADYYVSGIIRIDPADCVADPKCSASERTRNRRAHTWLSCANHHSTKLGNKFSTCVIDGVRRFKQGDVVSFSVTQAFRSINPYYKTTQFFIYKL